MIGEVAAVISALKALNDGINTIREAGKNAHGLSGIVGKWGESQEKYNEVELAKAGKMSYKEALAMESAKRQLINFDRQLKDICLMQGQADLYAAIKNRMEESRLAHEKEVARLKIKRREFKKNASLVLGLFVVWLFGMGVLYVIVKFTI